MKKAPAPFKPQGKGDRPRARGTARRRRDAVSRNGGLPDSEKCKSDSFFRFADTRSVWISQVSLAEGSSGHSLAEASKFIQVTIVDSARVRVTRFKLALSGRLGWIFSLVVLCDMTRGDFASCVTASMSASRLKPLSSVARSPSLRRVSSEKMRCPTSSTTRTMRARDANLEGTRQMLVACSFAARAQLWWTSAREAAHRAHLFRHFFHRWRRAGSKQRLDLMGAVSRALMRRTSSLMLRRFFEDVQNEHKFRTAIRLMLHAVKAAQRMWRNTLRQRAARVEAMRLIWNMVEAENHAELAALAKRLAALGSTPLAPWLVERRDALERGCAKVIAALPMHHSRSALLDIDGGGVAEGGASSRTAYHGTAVAHRDNLTRQYLTRRREADVRMFALLEKELVLSRFCIADARSWLQTRDRRRSDALLHAPLQKKPCTLHIDQRLKADVLALHVRAVRERFVLNRIEQSIRTRLKTAFNKLASTKYLSSTWATTRTHVHTKLQAKSVVKAFQVRSPPKLTPKRRSSSVRIFPSPSSPSGRGALQPLSPVVSRPQRRNSVL